MISAQGLVKRFGTFLAVDRFSFEVERGEIYGLLGPNGAGKTTTARLLTCLLRPSAGTARVAGYSIDEAPHAIRASVGILTEVPGLYERLTPAEYLDFFAQIHGLAAPRRAARIEEMLRLVGMWDRRRVVMRSFSKGMQQRVAIARALLHDPEVLFFDEPTAALDPEAARGVRDHLRDLASSRGRTVLLCTHNLPEAEQLCQRLSVVRGGRQIAEGTPAELKADTERQVQLRLRTTTPELLTRLARVPGLSDLAPAPGDGVVTYRTTTPERTNPDVVRTAVEAGADVLGLAEAEVSLEDVYLALVRSPRVTA
jgi:ABC-2 type transport system ATP-binding protein